MSPRIVREVALSRTWNRYGQIKSTFFTSWAYQPAYFYALYNFTSTMTSFDGCYLHLSNDLAMTII